jgi:hypothetical protein
MPKTTPVNMFHSPENTSVVERDIESWRASAIIKGRRVPRSPRDPEISAKGDLRSVDTLFEWIRRKSQAAIMVQVKLQRRCLVLIMNATAY